MNAPQLKSAESIFEELVELPAAERCPILAERCGADEQLRAFVEELLANHDRGMGDFLEAPTAPVPGEPQEPTERIGHYRLLEKLGEGGFGEVHLAEQTEPVQRRVALKIVKLGMDTKQVVARFEVERQALALMDHPNIAKVFEAGATERGRPYFVMEYVTGVPITDYCDRQRLDMEQRLELFIRACDAIQHAHQKGIIHRDVKPSNILVESVGDQHVPKVIDFGIAKAMGFTLTEQTLYTEQGQLIGTPEYMSPEQAEGSGHEVDTRTDIYSLGVLLYELLAGALPFDPQAFRGKGLDEIQHLIRDVEPPKPSTRLSTLHGEATSEGDSSIEAIALERRTDPRTLRRRLKGDLDWITMKAMEKQRARRYSSVSELAADIRRHLGDEPVIAGPPSAVYRLRKVVRRHKLGVTTAAAIVVVLLAGIAATSWQAVRATDAERLAEDRLTETETARAAAAREADIARSVNEFLNRDLLAAVDPRQQGRDVTMREVLDTASENIEERFEGEPIVESSILTTLGNTYVSLGHYAEAEPHLERALRLRRSELGPDHDHTLDSMSALFMLYSEQGRFKEAEALIKDVLERRRRIHGAEHPATIGTMSNLAGLYWRLSRYAEAESLFVAVLESRRQTLSEDDPRTLMAMNNLGSLYRAQGRFNEAETLLVDALELMRRVHGNEHPDTLMCLMNLAAVNQGLGRFEEAEPMYIEALEARRRVLGQEHYHTLASTDALAGLYWMQGRHDKVEPLLVESVQLHRRVLGETHPETIGTLNNLAMMYHMQGRTDEAEPLYVQALEGLRAVFGEEGAPTLIALSNLGELYRDTGRFGEAESLLLEALMARRRALGEEHPDTLRSMHNLGALYDAQGRDEEAEALYLEALNRRRRVLGPEHPFTLETLSHLAALYERLGRDEEAQKYRAQLEGAQGVTAKD
ncbi:MAG: tetratricopeptide repeat protein [Planctomycetota bacterium]|jgi:serine/threonine protein kinase/Flp pilus assembly protein TadD